MTQTTSHPKSVKIGPIVFSITYVDNLRDQDDGRMLAGQINQVRNTIRLNSELEFQARMQALIHEILHAVFGQCGLQFVEDKTLDAVAFKLYGFIRDNKDIIRLMLKDRSE